MLGTAITRFKDMEIARTGLSEREAVAAGFDALGVTTEASNRAHYYPGAQPMKIKLVVERGNSVWLLGAQIVGGADAETHRCSGCGAVEQDVRGRGGPDGPVLRTALLAGVGSGSCWPRARRLPWFNPNFDTPSDVSA